MPEYKTKVKLKKPSNFTVLVRLKQKTAQKQRLKTKDFTQLLPKQSKILAEFFFLVTKVVNISGQPTKN